MPVLLRLLHCAPILEYLSVEFPLTHKVVADMMARLRDGRILHLEFQVKNEPEMHWPMYHYYGTIQQRRPTAKVVHLGSGPMTMISSIDRPPECQFRCNETNILNIQEVPAGAFLRSSRTAERALAVLAKSNNPRAAVQKILASRQGLPDKETRANFERQGTGASCIKKRSERGSWASRVRYSQSSSKTPSDPSHAWSPLTSRMRIVNSSTAA